MDGQLLWQGSNEEFINDLDQSASWIQINPLSQITAALFNISFDKTVWMQIFWDKKLVITYWSQVVTHQPIVFAAEINLMKFYVGQNLG